MSGLPPAPGDAPAEPPASSAPDDVAQVIVAAYGVAVGRAPSADELRDARAFVAAQTAAHASAGRQDAALAARADLCQVLMGLNETLHIE